MLVIEGKDKDRGRDGPGARRRGIDRALAGEGRRGERGAGRMTRRGLVAAGLAAAAHRAVAAGAAAQTPAATPAAMPAAGYPRTIVDALGEVVIESRPERIFTPDPSFSLDTLLFLCVRPALVGTYAGWRWLPYQEGAAALPTLELGPAGPNIESLRAARIDLSVIPEMYAGWFLGEADVRRAGATAVTLPDGDFAGQLRVLGAALGLEERAEAGVADVQARLAAYQPPRIPSSVKAFGSYGDGTFFMYKPGGALSGMLERLGLPPLTQPADLGDQEIDPEAAHGISFEEIPALDADLLLGTDFEDGHVGAAEVEASPLFARLPAVREGRYRRLSGAESWALCYGSVLSLPLAMTTLTDALGG